MSAFKLQLHMFPGFPNVIYVNIAFIAAQSFMFQKTKEKDEPRDEREPRINVR